jgi:hypothetical protein
MGAYDTSYTDEQLAGIERLLADTGYAYDCRQNIFYSVKEPWQKKYGFCSLYDDWATPMGLVYDSEPLRFEYGGKRWLIDFWKGQYGITVGGEIGVYSTDKPDIDIPGVFHEPFYRGVGEDEFLDMSFTLARDGRALFTRSDRHWWLTGFVLGEYCDPKRLTMEASVTFGDEAMRDAFLQALYALGYSEGDIGTDGGTVFLHYGRPRSRQPLARRGPISFVTMLRTRALVEDYKRLTAGSGNMYDILTKLQAEAPLLYELAVGLGRRSEPRGPREEMRDFLGGSM